MNDDGKKSIESNTRELILGSDSPGVQRIEAITEAFTKWTKVSLFVSIFLVAYAYRLNGTIRYTYQVVLSFRKLQ